MNAAVAARKMTLPTFIYRFSPATRELTDIEPLRRLQPRHKHMYVPVSQPKLQIVWWPESGHNSIQPFWVFHVMYAGSGSKQSALFHKVALNL